MNKLVLLEGGEATPYELNADEVVLGRHPDCGIQLNSEMVSRRHARVFKRDDHLYLEDLGSGNGTFLNGKRLSEAVPLKNEDRIKLGPLLFRYDAAKKAAPTVKIPKLSNVPEGNFATISFDLVDDSDTSAITSSVQSSHGLIDLDSQPEEKLRGVLEIGRSAAGTVDIDVLLPKILDVLFDIFPNADRACILVKDSQTGQMYPRAYKNRRPADDDTVRISSTILKKVLEEKTGILSADATTDSRFDSAASISDLTIRSMMCVPMIDLDGEPIGVINIDTQNPIHRFKEIDLDLMVAVAGQAALSYENARLMQSHMEKQRQDREMGIAKNVQIALLPKSMPEIDGYEFFASYESALAVGGDYYDSIPLSGNKHCLAFGDVAGKGVPAALVMSRISSVVESTMNFLDDVKKAIFQINNLMCSNAVEGRFVTFVLMVIDLKKNRVHFANAGHMPPIVRKADGSIEEIGEEEVGVPLGVLDDFPYDVVTYQLDPGDTFIVYTDGVSEAMNHESELYGIEQLKETIKNGSSEPTPLGNEILKDVKRHANGRPQNDDITLMTFGRVNS